MKEIYANSKKFGRLAIAVDDDDYARLSQYTWAVNSSGYAMRSYGSRKARRYEYMHRLILGLSAGRHPFVDHVNGNKLDNRKENLRLCSHVENLQNQRKTGAATSSQYKGVYWHKTNRKWCALIKANGRRVYLGYFATELEAAKAYDNAATKYYGSFAKLNLKQNRDKPCGS